jgi:hypothetical protein
MTPLSLMILAEDHDDCSVSSAQVLLGRITPDEPVLLTPDQSSPSFRDWLVESVTPGSTGKFDGVEPVRRRSPSSSPEIRAAEARAAAIAKTAIDADAAFDRATSPRSAIREEYDGTIVAEDADGKEGELLDIGNSAMRDQSCSSMLSCGRTKHQGNCKPRLVDQNGFTAWQQDWNRSATVSGQCEES